MDEIALLPSLLDRLTDDSHTHQEIGVYLKKIRIQEEKLNNSNHILPEEEKLQIQKEIKNYQGHIDRLRTFIGSFNNIRDSVKRDLSWLLNSRAFYHNTNTILDKEKYPHVSTSVINYGLPDFTGKTVSDLQKNRLEKMMAHALLTYEPRIMPDTLELNITSDSSIQEHNGVIFEIKGMLWAEPAPIYLQVRTHLDLESGGMVILE